MNSDTQKYCSFGRSGRKTTERQTVGMPQG